MMRQLQFSDIAVFILATTRPNGKLEQDYRSYYHSRILPIRETWGSYFPDLYFVFGTNTFDYEFLKERCNYQAAQGTAVASAASQRLLRAREPQTLSRDIVDSYQCPVYTSELRLFTNHTKSDCLNQYDVTLSAPRSPKAAVHLSANSSSFPIAMHWNALFIANCTGEYFGIGPTCRCQETMRYFYYNSKFKKKTWFLFLDDDVYMRPYSLLSFLEMVQFNSSGVSVEGENPQPPTADAPIAMLAPRVYRGFKFSTAQMKRRFRLKNKLKKSNQLVELLKHNCSDADEYKFTMAQPAFINREGMNVLQSAINNNAMTRLHGLWGGSHDSSLGMLLWLYQIPSYSFQRAYYGSELYQSASDPVVLIKSHEKLRPSRMFLFHRIINFRSYSREKIPIWRFTHASQYFISDYLGDSILYDHQKNLLNSISIMTLIQQQKEIGKEGARFLFKLLPSGINRTIFAPYAKHLHEKYVDFTPDHCVLLSTITNSSSSAAAASIDE